MGDYGVFIPEPIMTELERIGAELDAKAAAALAGVTDEEYVAAVDAMLDTMERTFPINAVVATEYRTMTQLEIDEYLRGWNP